MKVTNSTYGFSGVQQVWNNSARPMIAFSLYLLYVWFRERGRAKVGGTMPGEINNVLAQWNSEKKLDRMK